MEGLDASVRQQLLKEDRAWIGLPLNLGEESGRAVQANARHMALLLRDSPMPDRASRVAAFAESLIDVTSSTRITAPLACGKGCAHCCTTYVSATLPEIFRLARAIRGKSATETRVIVAAARSRAMPQMQREVDRLLCPILEDNACSEYADRPLVCRAVLSTSLERCLDIFRDNKGGAFLYPPNAESMRIFMVVMLRAALIASGYPHQNYEMNHALEIALTHKKAEQRWLAGEPLFAGVAMDQAENQSTPLSQLAEKLAAVVKGSI